MIDQSFIYLLQHKPTEEYVGSVRVIFINENTPIQIIPMQRDGKVEGIEDLTQKSTYLRDLSFVPC